MKVETKAIRFKEGGHTALINVADFDPKVHEELRSAERDRAAIDESVKPKRGPGRPPKRG